jgi:hypothetical protein
MLGAFLHAHESGQIVEPWYHDSLPAAAQWLKNNNPYLSAYSSVLESYVDANELATNIEPVWPVAQHIPEDQSAPRVNQIEIVVPNYDFPDDVHNEDAHYSRLMVGFLQTRDHKRIPVSFGDRDLEPLLFPDLFPDGHGHFRDHEMTSSGRSKITDETYGKYIKHRLQGIDSRFRLHPTWPMWSYLQLEKLRNHQNTARLLRIKDAERSTLPNTARDLLCQSLYGDNVIIDEEKTDPLPTFIRTGDTYFREKQYHLDTMITNLQLPTLFITLTMAEGKWTQLHDILAATDNGDTLPSNRPFHAAQHFAHRLRSLKTHLWKNSQLVDWGTIDHFFERIEFQNRGAAHLHGCYWTSTSTSDLLAQHTIRSDLPDPETEPELYHAVIANQIHECKPSLCSGPALPGERCKKGFPRPFSSSTYEDPASLYYIYECHKPEDQYVVPYHPATLLAWKAHINVQYVSTRGFARYMVKYISKSEPTHVFNIREGDRFQQHVVARRLGAMEAMFLLLGETICNSSIQVLYLTTEPPESRPKAVKPIHLLHQDENSPFWDDYVTKYFARPADVCFEEITYDQYFSQYSVTRQSPKKSQAAWVDQLGNFVQKRKDPILVRFRHTRITDGEPYFYQLLLRNHSWRSEVEIRGGHATYRDHYLALHPEETSIMQDETRRYLQQRSSEFTLKFDELLETLLSRLQSIATSTVAQIIRTQMTALRRAPIIIPRTGIAELPTDQFAALNTLMNKLGRSGRDKYPFYFLTGPAGTGKSYVISLFVEFLRRTNKNYVLLAPTGVAAQNISGQTVHSALRITQSSGHYTTLAFHDRSLYDELNSLDCIIIDEISMVSAGLLDFLSNMFARIKQNALAFGGIPVVVSGDLYQLPPVEGPPVFRAAVWSIFYPLFLTQSRRQEADPEFYKILNEIRVGNISQDTWNLLYQRYKKTIQTSHSADILTTTYIVGMCHCAQSINVYVCNTLPVMEDQFLLSTADDVIHGEAWEGSAQKLFKGKTNLPEVVRLQPGARVMLLNNDHFQNGLCNGSIGYVTKIDLDACIVYVAFQVSQNNTSSMLHLALGKTTKSFFINGAHASRTQFPLQNCFALTAHKAQGVTLPSTNIHLDKQFFAPGHSYVALSRASSWKNISISALDPAAFKVDPAVTREYARLNELNANLPTPQTST